jgi:hypothetical protein
MWAVIGESSEKVTGSDCRDGQLRGHEDVFDEYLRSMICNSLFFEKGFARKGFLEVRLSTVAAGGYGGGKEVLLRRGRLEK